MEAAGNSITTETHSDVTVVGLAGEHDVTTAGAVREQLRAVVASGGGLVVSLMETTFFDSSIVHALFDVDQQLQEGDRRLVLHVATAPIVRRVLEVSMLADTVPCIGSLSEAVERAGRRSPAD